MKVHTGDCSSSRRAALSTAISGMIVVGLSLSLSAALGPEPAATAVGAKSEEKGADKKDARKKSSTRGLSVDELYIQDMLEEYLQPTKIMFLEDGRVKMLFDFSLKNEEHADIFRPEIEKKVNSTFRWSLPREESYYSYNSPPEKGEDGRYIYHRGGLRISDKGMALLKCWFEDDVEAKISFGTGTNFIRGQTVSLVFCTKSGKALGSNFGTQCVTYSGGRATRSEDDPESMIIYTRADFGLVVRNGEFEAHRNGRRKTSMEYSKKAFKSGMIGFLWGGRVAGLVHRMEIKGRLDVPKMAREMRKALRRKK